MNSKKIVAQTTERRRAPRIPIFGKPRRKSRPGKRVALSLVAAIVCLASLGHESLGDFPRHHAALTVGAVNIDVALELAFYPAQSVPERRRMDVNGDGQVDPSEARAYARRLSRMAEKAIRISVDGVPTTVITLFEPELELFDAGGGHVLRLFLFARTPPKLKQKGHIEIRDELWADAPALASLEAAGARGIQIMRAAETALDARFVLPGEKRIFQVAYRRVENEGESTTKAAPTKLEHFPFSSLRRSLGDCGTLTRGLCAFPGCHVTSLVPRCVPRNDDLSVSSTKEKNNGT